MRKILLGLVTAALAVGCGAVTHDELQRELAASREEVMTEVNQGDLATLDCAATLNVARQAAVFCAMGAYCNVVEAWVSHCERRNADGELMPPLSGVGDAVTQAIQDFDAATSESRVESSEEDSSVESSD